MNYIAIFIGGGLGSVLRYGVQMLMHERITLYNFPWPLPLPLRSAGGEVRSSSSILFQWELISFQAICWGYFTSPSDCNNSTYLSMNSAGSFRSLK